MFRTFYAALLVCCTLACFGQSDSIPPAIQTPPDSSRLILHVYAKGVQAYICQQDPKDTSHYVWTLTGPRAGLYPDNSYQNEFGRHYFNAAKQAVWENKEGSSITGIKLHQADSPDPLAIPWLLVKAVGTKGTGILSPVVYIQRINTVGGKAPATATRQDNGRKEESAYTAEYLFYGTK